MNSQIVSLRHVALRALLCCAFVLSGLVTQVEAQTVGVAMDTRAGAKTRQLFGFRSIRQPDGVRIGGSLGTGYLMRESKQGSGSYPWPTLNASGYARFPVARRLVVGVDVIGQRRLDALRRGGVSGARPGSFAVFSSLEASATAEYLIDNRTVDAYIYGGVQGLLLYNQSLTEDYWNFGTVERASFSFYDKVGAVRPIAGVRFSEEIAHYTYLDVDLRAIGPETFTHVDGEEELGVQFMLRVGVSWSP